MYHNCTPAWSRVQPWSCDTGPWGDWEADTAVGYVAVFSLVGKLGQEDTSENILPAHQGLCSETRPAFQLTRASTARPDRPSQAPSMFTNGSGQQASSWLGIRIGAGQPQAVELGAAVTTVGG